MKIPFLNKTFIFLITGIRPIFGIAHCRYPVSCTKFAVWQLEKKRVCLSPFGQFANVLHRVIRYGNGNPCSI